MESDYLKQWILFPLCAVYALSFLSFSESVRGLFHSLSTPKLDAASYLNHGIRRFQSIWTLIPNLHRMTQCVRSTMRSLMVQCSFILVDAMHCGYYHFDDPSMMPLVHWTVTITVWIRDRRHSIAFVGTAGLTFLVLLGNVLSTVLLFLFDHGYFADIYIQRIEQCPSTDLGDPSCSNQRDGTFSINNLPEFHPAIDWTNDSAEDLFIDSWIVAMNDEKAKVDSLRAALDSLFGSEHWTDSDHFNDTESWRVDPFHSILDDLLLGLEATERIIDELDDVLNRPSYSSFGDKEWVRSFWAMADGMDFGDVRFVEYVPESHLMANPFCSHYLEITASFQYPVLRQLAITMNIASMIGLVVYLWRYWSILRTLSIGNAAVYWADILLFWTSSTLNQLATDCMARCSDWNRFAVRRRLENDETSRSLTKAALDELDLFPDGINGIIEGMLFHDLVQEISSEKAMVRALREQWAFKRTIIWKIRIYAFGHREHSVQIHYPLNTDGSLMMLAHFRLRTTMRRIRVLVVYADTGGDSGANLAVLPRKRASGKTVALDLESTGFVDPDYVIA